MSVFYSLRKLQRKVFCIDVIALPRLFCVVIILCVGFFPAWAQQAIELNSSSYPGAIPNGPATSSQMVQFKENTTGSSFVNLSNHVLVTAAFSNQQFTSVPGAPAGMMFGADIVGSLDINVVPQPVWASISSKGAPANATFTSNPYGTTGTGIDVNQNYGFYLLNTTNMWLGTSGPAGQRAYYGDLNFTFSRPVSDPVIHLAELGGIMGPNGMSTELELPAGSGLTLTRLSGSSALNIPASNDKILNSSPTPNAACASGAAICGSVRINGTNISSVTFRVYVRFQNTTFGPLTPATTPKGDAFIISFSFAAFGLSGNVFDDANGLTDNTVNGTPTNAGGTLQAMAVDADGNVQGTTPVSASGQFSFDELVKGMYTVRLSTSTGVLGSTAPAASVPFNWVNTGENLGAVAGSDGIINGDLAVSINTSDVTNANLGIDQIPTANTITYTLVFRPVLNSSVTLNGPVGSPTVGLTPIRLNGADAEDGLLDAGEHVVINTLPVYGLLKYNDIPVTAGQSIPNFNPDLLTEQFTSGDYTSVSFTYSYKDAANVSSVPATYTINFPAGIPLPVSFVSFTASLQNGNALLAWQTAAEQDNFGFYVQHSIDGRMWETIGFVNGAGNSQSITNYEYTHHHISKGTHYYRLQQADMNGNTKYSDTRLVNMGKEAAIQVYPNPASDVLYIIHDSQNQLKELSLFDITGRQVLNQKDVRGGSIQLNISGLQPGTYLLKLQYSNAEPGYRKIIKQ